MIQKEEMNRFSNTAADTVGRFSVQIQPFKYISALTLENDPISAMYVVVDLLLKEI